MEKQVGVDGGGCRGEVKLMRAEDEAGAGVQLVVRLGLGK